MTINITFDGKPYRVIKKEDSFVLSISVSDRKDDAVFNLDELDLVEGFVRYMENLPNGKFVELVIAKADKEIIGRYHGLEIIHAVFDKVTISATL